MDAYRGGVNAQYAFSDLPASDREFIISGMTQDEWDAAFKEKDDTPVSHTSNSEDDASVSTTSDPGDATYGE
jgi:hypothetical protein